jgi:hypothetical protein
MTHSPLDTLIKVESSIWRVSSLFSPYLARRPVTTANFGPFFDATLQSDELSTTDEIDPSAQGDVRTLTANGIMADDRGEEGPAEQDFGP